MFRILWSFAIDLFSNVLFQTFHYFWHVPTKLSISLCWLFFTNFRSCETFTEKKSRAILLLIEPLSNFRTIKCWFILYLQGYILGQCKFKCIVYPTRLSCNSHSIDICTVAIKNIKNMHAVSTNQIADILLIGCEEYLLRGILAVFALCFQYLYSLAK